MNHPELIERLRDSAERNKVPGAAAGFLVEGSQVIATTGVTSIDNPLPITRDTLFTVGSMTKTFTATAIMMLVDQGKVDLERPSGLTFPI